MAFSQQPTQHFPTYLELKAAHAFPKWANTVCFSEKSTNPAMVMEESSWNTKDETATEFMVYGPKGNLGIQTDEYDGGNHSLMRNGNAIGAWS
jgi:hypothetical protein